LTFGQPNPYLPRKRILDIMRRPSRKMVLWSAGGLGVFLVVAILVVSWFSGQGLLHPDRELLATTPTESGLVWEWSNFTAEDGVPLVGWWMPADPTPADNGTVIFLHGYGDSKAQSLEVAPFLHRGGYNVLAFDFRASGESGGDYSSAGILEVRDVAAAVHAVASKPGMPSDPWIALVGWSMGGATAIRSAPRLPEVDAVITDGAFSRLQNIVDTSITHFFKKTIGIALPKWPFGPLAVTFAGWSIGQDIGDNVPARDIKDLDRPILLIHGTADTTVTPQNLEDLIEAHPTAQVLRIQDGLHVRSYLAGPELYEATVLAFLDDATGDPAAP
jgi:uncharacterized protein